MSVRVSKSATNIREKLAELDKPSGIAGEAMLRADSVQEQRNLIGAGRKNILINGSFQVSQRGSWASATAAVNGAITVDRWQVHLGTVSATAQDTGKKLKIAATSTNASAYLIQQQIVEFHTDYASKTVTASAKITSNNANARLGIYDGVTHFSSPAHSGNGTEELLTVTATLGASPTTLKIRPIIASAIAGSVSITSGDYIEFGEVQLELGSVATDFEHRSYGEELALCQRYYYLHVSGVNKQIASAAYYTSTSAYGHVSFPVTMRSIPSLEASSGSSHFTMYANSIGRTSNSLVAQGGTESQINVYLTTSTATAGHGGFLYSNSASTRVAFDAEL